MQKFEKLKLNRDFKRLYSRGKSFVAPAFVLYVCKTKRDCVRLGITAGKKIGGAVQRNRAKRVITAAIRDCLPQITAGCDIVVVARAKILRQKSTQVAEAMKKQLSAAGFWCEDESDKQTVNASDKIISEKHIPT